MARNWLTDFKYEDGAWLVKKTGHRVPATFELANDIFTWLSFYTLAQVWRTSRRLTGHKRPTIAFYPEKPRPWYFVWPVMHVSGAKLISDVEKADIVFQFEDATMTSNVVPKTKPGARLVNFDCNDISKSIVADAFEAAAGYSLAVNPREFDGPMVEKSEKNACHDGRIIEGPMDPIPGKSYQRLIDNEVPGGFVEDIRPVICGGKIGVVFLKRRAISRRFMNENSEVDLTSSEKCLSPEEVAIVERFAANIGLEWGGVDILRDRHSGKIFIVDANKTDMGPPIALKLGDKLKSTRRMARAFARAFAP